VADQTRKCPHCRGTGVCHACRGTGRLALQKGKQCTSCFPHGSGKCQNCRGLGGFDQAGHPAGIPGQEPAEPGPQEPAPTEPEPAES